jgi:hypothetical protein
MLVCFVYFSDISYVAFAVLLRQLLRFSCMAYSLLFTLKSFMSCVNLLVNMQPVSAISNRTIQMTR